MKLRFTNRQIKTYGEGKVTTVSYDCLVMHGKTVLRSYRVTGKATRSKEDEQNETVAIHIADSRAKEQAYLVAANGANREAVAARKQELLNDLTAVNFIEKMLWLRSREHTHVREVVLSTCK